jgi:hypothetical protein
MRDSTEIFEGNDDFFFKYLFLTCFRKISILLPEARLREHIQVSTLSNFISKILDSNDILIVVIMLLIIQSVVEKLPEIKNELSRHGVVSYLKRIADRENTVEYIISEVYKKPVASPAKGLPFPGMLNKPQTQKERDDVHCHPNPLAPPAAHVLAAEPQPLPREHEENERERRQCRQE